ncbi:MAG: GNAT family N-acetyltransferase, partial [Candidatus Gracilibacteria bacterium]|nr:GNAT family N-acetyltransferase [Candidatus Gracilibacteria bacterium]
IREIHVYGQQVVVGEKKKDKNQHFGLGALLMKRAEDVAKENGFKKIAVIAGIGTREYYKKRGYKLSGTYMLKSI